MTKFGLTHSDMQKLIKLLAQNSFIQKAIIYGSRAKGNFEAYSDIDITLIAPYMDLSGLHKIANDIDDLLLPYKVDISLFHSISNPDLIDHINSEGKIFYQREVDV